MKKYLLSLITLTFFLCEASFTGGMAFAAATQISGTDLTWDLTNGVLTIDYDGSGTGKQMPDYATGSSSPWYSSRANVTSIIIKDNVTKIGQNAFYSCSNATTVQISSDVITIGTDAFYGCSKLATINYRKNTMGSSTLTTTKQWSQITFANEKANPLAANSSGGELWYVNSYYSGGMSYRLEKATSVMNLTGITSIKNYAFVGNKAIASVTLSPSITSIGTSAFKNCKALTTVNFGSNGSNLCNVESIGSSGFDGCTKISRVIVYGGLAKWLAISFGSNDANPFGDSTEETRQLFFDGTADANKVTTLSLSANINSYAFFNNNTITSVSINENVTSIGNYAFKQCSALESLSLPSTLTTIGSDAFYDCNALTSYSYASDIEHWINIDFGSAHSNPMNNVHKCFIGNSEQTSIVIPNEVSTIKARSFAGCTGLTSITLPASLTTCGTGAFDGCSSVNLTNVNYLGSITDWCKINFANSTANPARYSGSLRINGVEQTDVYLESSLAQIKDFAFYNNTALTRISIDGSTTIATDALTGCSAELVLRGTVSGSCGSGVTWLLSDNGVLTISGTGAGTMTNYTNNTHAPWVAYKSIITQVVIEEGVTSIGNYAFNNCSNIRSISLPEGLQTIGNNAFNIGSFPYLTEIVIPSTVTTIGSYAFRLCGALEKVTVLATSPLTSITARTVGSSSGNSYYYDIFADAVFSSAALYVPISQLANYKAANGWKLFTHFHISGTCGAEGDNLTWDYDENATTLTISGSGAMADYTSSNHAPWYDYRTNISSIVYEGNVTSIGNYAFYGCTGILEFSLPESITLIGGHSFQNCSGLPATITIPEQITYMGDMVFSGCPVTSVEWNARNYTSTNLSTGINPFYSRRSNITSFTFGNTVENIPSYLCYGMSNASFTSVTIPSSVTSIGTNVFQGCSKLNTITWEAANCENFNSTSEAPFDAIKAQITTFNFSNSVRTIPAYLCAGMNNASFTSLVIPTTIESIGTDAFDGCTNLSRVDYRVVPTQDLTITYIDDWAQIDFANEKANPLYNGGTLYVIVPPSGNSQPGPGEQRNLVFKNSTTTIKPYAFVNDTRITSVTFGTSMANIGANAFDGCTNIASVTANAESVPTLSSSAFPAAVKSSAKLYLPHSITVKANYRADENWDDFTEANTFPKIVQFDLNGQTGDAIDPLYFDNLTSKASVPSDDPSADYYTFGGWYENAEGTGSAFAFSTTNITADKILYAKWTEDTHTVTVAYKYGETTIQASGSVSGVGVATAQNATAPEITGYTFSTWSAMPSGVTTSDELTSATISINATADDKTITANYTINSYDVTFDLQGHGSAIAAQSVNYNGLVTEPSDPEADYYTFGGWFKEPDCSNEWNFSEDHVTTTTTLYAKWTLNGLALDEENENNDDLITAYNGLTTNVTMTRSLTNAQYNTFCLPFSLSASEMASKFGEGYDLEELTGVTYNDATKELGLEFTQRYALEAGKPYLLQPANEVVNPSFSNVEVDASTPSDGLDNTYLAFHGIYSPTSLEGDNHNLLFLGADNTLFWPAETGDMKGFRAYFEIKSPARNAVSARIIRSTETTINVETMADGQSPVTNKVLRDGQLLIIRDGKTYNAQGMRVE